MIPNVIMKAKCIFVGDHSVIKNFNTAEALALTFRFATLEVHLSSAKLYFRLNTVMVLWMSSCKRLTSELMWLGKTFFRTGFFKAQSFRYTAAFLRRLFA